jgi:hypothetical protein
VARGTAKAVKPAAASTMMEKKSLRTGLRIPELPENPAGCGALRPFRTPIYCIYRMCAGSRLAENRGRAADFLEVSDFEQTESTGAGTLIGVGVALRTQGENDDCSQ